MEFHKKCDFCNPFRFQFPIFYRLRGKILVILSYVPYKRIKRSYEEILINAINKVLMNDKIFEISPIKLSKLETTPLHISNLNKNENENDLSLFYKHAKNLNQELTKMEQIISLFEEKLTFFEKLKVKRFLSEKAKKKLVEYVDKLCDKYAQEKMSSLTQKFDTKIMEFLLEVCHICPQLAAIEHEQENEIKEKGQDVPITQTILNNEKWRKNLRGLFLEFENIKENISSFELTEKYKKLDLGLTKGLLSLQHIYYKIPPEKQKKSSFPYSIYQSIKNNSNKFGFKFTNSTNVYLILQNAVVGLVTGVGMGVALFQFVSIIPALLTGIAGAVLVGLMLSTLFNIFANMCYHISKEGRTLEREKTQQAIIGGSLFYSFGKIVKNSNEIAQTL